MKPWRDNRHVLFCDYTNIEWIHDTHVPVLFLYENIHMYILYRCILPLSFNRIKYMDTFNLFILQISLKYSLIISSNCVHSGRKCYLQLINSYVIMKQHVYIYIETKREYYSDIYNILKDIEKL